jgi:hypothetical protein
MSGGPHHLRALGLAAAALCALFVSGLDAPAPARANSPRPASSLSRKSPGSEHLTRIGEVPRIPAAPSLDRVDGPRFPAFSGGSPRRSPHSPAARFEARVVLVSRLFRPFSMRQGHGRVADRPLLVTCPAQGPPSRA